MGILVIGINEDRFTVDRDRFEKIVADTGEDWKQVTAWVEQCGTQIPLEDTEIYGKPINLK